MREKRGLKDKFQKLKVSDSFNSYELEIKQILRSKLVVSILIFIAVSLVAVIAGDIIVKEGAMDVSGNFTTTGTGTANTLITSQTSFGWLGFDTVYGTEEERAVADYQLVYVKNDGGYLKTTTSSNVYIDDETMYLASYHGFQTDSHGNSDNWYDTWMWGNHAEAGYYKSYSTTSYDLCHDWGYNDFCTSWDFAYACYTPNGEHCDSWSGYYVCTSYSPKYICESTSSQDIVVSVGT